jgi:hypothetical protein
VWYLYQAKDRSILSLFLDRWISSDALELSAELAPHWNTLRSALAHSGIHLNELDEQLMWSGGDHSGKLIVQNVYIEITHTLWHTNIKG